MMTTTIDMTGVGEIPDVIAGGVTMSGNQITGATVILTTIATIIFSMDLTVTLSEMGAVISTSI
jgi:hypothetical protein